MSNDERTRLPDQRHARQEPERQNCTGRSQCLVRRFGKARRATRRTGRGRRFNGLPASRQEGAARPGRANAHSGFAKRICTARPIHFENIRIIA